MKNNKKVLSGFFLVILILIMTNIAFAFPITGKVIEISATETMTEKTSLPEKPVLCEACIDGIDTGKKDSKGCPIYNCPIQEKPIICEMCIGGTDTGKIDTNGCAIYECPIQEEPICPENCICKGNTITCPTLHEELVEVEISTSKGSSSISVEKISEDSISIREGSTSVKTSKKLVIEEKKLMMETSQGNKEVKVMPSTASETAINQLKLKNYEIELKDIGKPVYEITGKKDVKVIGFIHAEMVVKSQINAETGAVEKTEKPWWSFLAKG